MSYIYTDYHPAPVHTHGKRAGKKIGAGDCVIRAMHLAFGFPKDEEGWKMASMKLFLRSLNVNEGTKKAPEAYTQTNDETWESFCEKVDFPKYTSRGSYYTVKEVAEATKNDDQGYILRVCNHIVYVKGGNWYDSWNSGGEKVRNVWKLKEEHKFVK